MLKLVAKIKNCTTKKHKELHNEKNLKHFKQDGQLFDQRMAKKLRGRLPRMEREQAVVARSKTEQVLSRWTF